MKKRILCLLLALFTLTSLAACKKNPDEPTYFGALGNGHDDDLDIPNYDNNDFIILTNYIENDGGSSIFASEKNPSAVNEGLNKRISDVESLYKLNISEKASGNPLADIETNLLSGEKPYDLIIVPIANTASTLISGNKLAKLNDISVFDFSLDCYDSNFIRDTSIGNNVYMVTGDLLNDSKSKISAVLFNNQIAEEIGFKEKYGDINSLVASGGFTLDFMYGAAEAANVEGTVGKSKPIFKGLHADILSVFSFCVGSANYIFTKDASDIPYISISHNNFFDSYQKLSKFEFDTTEIEIDAMFSSCSDKFAPNSDNITPALFTVATLKDAKRLREAGDCFSILPMPKADAAQTSYNCHVDVSQIECAAILSDAADISRSATVLDGLFKKSSPIIQSNLLEPLKSKCRHDDTDTLNIVLKSSKFDIGEMFGWGEFDIALADNLYASDLKSAFDNNISTRFDAAQKAMDIVLKRIIGDNYKEEAP